VILLPRRVLQALVARAHLARLADRHADCLNEPELSVRDTQDVPTKRLVLEQRRGSLISRDAAQRRAFAFARMLRDRWLAWPARVGPQLAAALEALPLDAAGEVLVLLEPALATFEQHAALALERAPADQG
jgi:hypothetical protein